jgi:hypothetical protein
MKKAISILLVWAVGVLAAPARALEQKPLPPVDEVLKGVLEKASDEEENNRLFKASYSYTRSKRTEFKNSRGVVKRVKAKSKQNVPQPDAPSTLNEPEAKVDVSKRPYEESDFPIGEELLARFDYKLVGRELVDGRPALILEFAPAKKKLSEKNLKEKCLNRAAGRAWIDEEDLAVVKADIHLTKPVGVIGGLVGSVQKFKFNFVRKRTPEGLWFTFTMDWHLEGRELIVERIIDCREEIQDVVCVKPVEPPTPQQSKLAAARRRSSQESTTVVR